MPWAPTPPPPIELSPEFLFELELAKTEDDILDVMFLYGHTIPHNSRRVAEKQTKEGSFESTQAKYIKQGDLIWHGKE